MPTSCGVGQCASEGVNTCTAGVFNDTCTPGAPVTEICDNGLDNDCDGSTDESGYLFVGFTAPVDNPTIENVAKAGSAVPLKFSATTCTGAPVTPVCHYLFVDPSSWLFDIPSKEYLFWRIRPRNGGSAGS